MKSFKDFIDLLSRYKYDDDTIFVDVFRTSFCVRCRTNDTVHINGVESVVFSISAESVQLSPDHRRGGVF